MKVLIVACLMLIAVSANLGELGAKFQAFKLKYGKNYLNQAEETKRFAIFEDNLRSIEEHNALYEQGMVSYKEGINQFTDMTSDEFRAMLTLSVSNKPHLKATQHMKTGLAVPTSVDWRTKGQVTGVKNQGACGSCWAFSVIGSTEAAYYRKSGKLVSLSEQQLVDCTNYGCSGGLVDPIFPYIEQYGIESENSYPYIAKDDSCKYNSSKVVTKISSYKAIYGDEDALLDAVANIGPVSVTMDASSLGSYQSGIFSCSYVTMNHAVLIVGYGVENNKKFWIVKNSWGSSFGEQGYFRIARGVNSCGIARDNVYPLV